MGAERASVLVTDVAETTENLAALSTRDLAARKAACDRVVDSRVRGFIEALNVWLVEAVPELRGLSGVVGMQGWELLVTGATRCNCFMVGLSNIHQRTALIIALGRCGFNGVILREAEGMIVLSIGPDLLDKGFVAPRRAVHGYSYGGEVAAGVQAAAAAVVGRDGLGDGDDNPGDWSLGG